MGYLSFDFSDRKGSFALPELQSHDFYEFYFLLAGRRTLVIEDRVYEVQPGDLAVIPPFTLHRTEGDSFRRVNLYVSASLLEEAELRYLREVGGKCLRLPPPLSASISTLLLGCFDPEGRPLPQLREYGESVLRTLFFLLLSSPQRPHPSDHSAYRHEMDPLPLQVVSFIREHFSEPITLDSVSSAFHISHVTLSRHFREAMHTSVMQYAAWNRLNYAKRLLAETNDSLEIVSEKCGYSSANYFSLIFKRSVGIPPSAFRRINRPGSIKE